MFEKILVPVDGSDPSLRALDLAFELAKHLGSRLTLLHAWTVASAPMAIAEPTVPMPSHVPVVTPEEISRMADAERIEGDHILKEALQRIGSTEIPVETKMEEGDTVHKIVEMAKQGHFDLIVMGVRGISKIRELLMGSVSEGVIKQAPCPVLLTR